jgi:hypothetical protein
LVLCLNKVNPVRSLLLPSFDMLTGIGVSFLYAVFRFVTTSPWPLSHSGFSGRFLVLG